MENVIHYKNAHTLKNVVKVEAKFQRKKFFGESINLCCTFKDGSEKNLRMGRMELLTAIWENLTAIWENPSKQYFSPKKIMYLQSVQLYHEENDIHMIRIFFASQIVISKLLRLTRIFLIYSLNIVQLSFLCSETKALPVRGFF
jgi:hypothetical protein